ncbi:glycosyl transferase family 2 [Salana multivorans]|uniref:Glycosyl transferase family 2 n=2 Tax=Salana multivorans TaxID=120377 RepID=A0A3N2D7L9_9MICO|nr:glycosyl transferase family 2 [Salana multivorans]
MPEPRERVAPARRRDAERVTIVMRTKDRAPLLRRALDDVLAQTLAAWHLVVVNDGGARQPVDVLLTERETAFDGRVEVVHVDGGSGSMEAAANLGVERARGDFVVVHDDDDTWAPTFLEEMVAALDADEEAVAAAARTEIVHEDFDGTSATEIRREPFVPPGEVVSLFDLLRTNRVVPISLLVRRRVYDEIGLYDPVLKAVGDWEFNLRLLQHGRVVFVGSKPLAFWHQRRRAEGTASNSIFGGADHHLFFDRHVRDRELRDYIERNGIGGLLFLAGYIEETARYYSLQETVRRVLHRVRDRGRTLLRLGRRR